MYGKKKMNHDSKNFSKNDKQHMKNVGNFSSKGLKQMPKNATFGKVSKRQS